VIWKNQLEENHIHYVKIMTRSVVYYWFHTLELIYSLCCFSLLDKEFKKQIIRHVMYFKVELKHITNTLTNNHYELLERVQSIEKFLSDKPTKLNFMNKQI